MRRRIELVYELWNDRTAQSCSPIVAVLCRVSLPRAGQGRAARRHNRKDQTKAGVRILDRNRMLHSDRSYFGLYGCTDY